jgi:hypothetical protein
LEDAAIAIGVTVRIGEERDEDDAGEERRQKFKRKAIRVDTSRNSRSGDGVRMPS